MEFKKKALFHLKDISRDHFSVCETRILEQNAYQTPDPPLKDMPLALLSHFSWKSLGPVKHISEVYKRRERVQ